MIYNEGKYITVSTEGGHTDFSLDDETEAELMFYLKKKFGLQVMRESLQEAE